MTARALVLLALAAALVGCGMAAPAAEAPPPQTSTAAGEVADEATRAPAAPMPQQQEQWAVPRSEPTSLEPGRWTLAPTAPPRVLLASLEIPPGEAFRPPSTSCQDVIIFLRAGELEATGTGIAPADAPAAMYADDAVRFGPEGDGVLVNASGRSARTVMAVARRSGSGPARLGGGEAEDCPVSARHDPLRRPIRIASVATTATLDGPGDLRTVTLLDLDADEHGSLALLTGPPGVAVAEHRHHGTDEILLFEQGAGTLDVGARQIEIHPGASVYIPAGEVHSFRGSGSGGPLRVIQIFAPE